MFGLVGEGEVTDLLYCAVMYRARNVGEAGVKERESGPVKACPWLIEPRIYQSMQV